MRSPFMSHTNHFVVSIHFKLRIIIYLMKKKKT